MTADLRQTTAGDLVTRIRETADMETGDLVVGDSFVTDAELLRHLDASYSRLWGLLAAKDVTYAESEQTLTGDGSANTFDLSADFLGVIAVDKKVNGRWIEIPHYTIRERNLISSDSTEVGEPRGWRLVGDPLVGGQNVPVAIRFLPTPKNGQEMRVLYKRYAPSITATSDVIYGWNGWDQWIVLDVAIKIRSKEESSTDKLERQQARIFDEITAEADLRDMEPVRMTETSTYGDEYFDAFDPAFRYPIGGA